MTRFGKKLRARARELGLSDAEVARRAGLTERRYGNYVTGIREPDFTTLVRICDVLATTPDFFLGIMDEPKKQSENEKLLSRLIVTANELELPTLRLLLSVAETFRKHDDKQKREK
jgi:transcriptional regulator with XRE-family HTH domain